MTNEEFDLRLKLKIKPECLIEDPPPNMEAEGCVGIREKGGAMTGKTIFKDNETAIKVGVEEISKRQIAVSEVRNKYALLRARVYQLSTESTIVYNRDNEIIQVKLAGSMNKVIEGLNELENYEIKCIERSRI